MPTILSIIGARPQFIKHAALQVQLSKHFTALTLHTGQHYDAAMSGIFFEELDIPAPDYMLDVGGGKPHGEQTGIIMREVEQVCMTLKPDAVLIYGDTNTTLAGALVAAKLGILCMHVEAGIRSYNRSMPEEINRIVADTFSGLLFCPVPEAVENLRKEGIAHEGVHLTGDVMCDLLERMRPKIRLLVDHPYYFATIHRPYNTDNPERMKRIFAAFDGLDHPVVLPIHPRLRIRLQEQGISLERYPNIEGIEPVGYLDSISYQAGAECVITDSSGVQKESYLLRKKCITLRSETEWNETLQHGWNTLVFEDIESLAAVIKKSPGLYLPHIFGDGQAAAAITQIIVANLTQRNTL